ncbi:hypothetical protein [Acetohalobium arabaticum]|uniref:DUF1819 domain-containing protein n=1 Tax=Acetohalobium arabaticum (strain ATCC 49924 / DSM 5501 / Z-7288) TaxID=574087 RepID=D9QQV5_ACEAZ|nr:hypothetical protein [Acetohalobium arabaticum]ADL12896.1 conserved hypothetical protein [Acetohalobium arabaticum DSM 5501]
MKGFDRPLKPEWVYEMIQRLEVGDKLSEHKEELDEVLKELTGKTGKRKVRTVIGRYFLKDLDKPRQRSVQDSLIFRLIKEQQLDEVKPVMLFNLLVKAPILQYFSEQLFNLYERQQEINAAFLRKKAYQRIGERDIARRSLRNFLSTLTDFGILQQQDRKIFIWNKRLIVNEENFINFLKLYSKFYLKSPQISLNDLPEYLLFYFDLPNVREIAQKYNNVHWDYTRRLQAAIVTLY